MVEAIPSEAQVFNLMKAGATFSLDPCDSSVDLTDSRKFMRLPMNDEQRLQLSVLMQQLPQAMAAGTLANAYIARLPKGLPHTLSRLKRGGYFTALRGEGGRFVGSAELHPLGAQAAVLGAMAAMGAVSGQYFLTQINSELTLINHKLDDILGFLYGDKSAELIAQINFVKYAHANFGAIMMCEAQRQATLTNLQTARIVAMKNIEFYLTDLESTVKKPANDFQSLRKQQDKALLIKDSIELSRQLYVLSGILEIYYAQNYDPSYIGYVEDEIVSYINKCDRKIAGTLSELVGTIRGYKPRNPLDRTVGREDIAKALAEALLPYSGDKDSPIRVSLRKSLDALHDQTEFYIDHEDNVYIAKTQDQKM